MVFSADAAGLLGGELFVEHVFALPGMGTLVVQSAFNLDVPVVVGKVTFSAVVIAAANPASQGSTFGRSHA